MRIPFHKYQGAGNDFIILTDDACPKQSLDAGLIANLCDRRYGIGADGLIHIASHSQYDFVMDYYNADGSEAFCGNGSRCAVDWAVRQHRVDKAANEVHFLAGDRSHQAFFERDWVYVKMQDVVGIRQELNGYFLNTGAPHFVQIVENVEEIDVQGLGSFLRHSKAFEEGANINFIMIRGYNRINLRTYEKGVEGETYACGTGAVAAALVGTLYGYTSPVHVSTQGGRLQVRFVAGTEGFQDIYLGGPVAEVFEGAIDTVALDSRPTDVFM